jgi:type IV pilus assembly protein PilM
MAVKPVVGLDIGSYQIKAVELTAGKEGLTITSVAVAPTPPGVMQNGVLIDPQLMGQTVKQMLREAGIRTKRVIGCVAGQSSVVVRIIEVPKMTPQELEETMKWEVERHVPFAPTEAQMAYAPLPVQDTNETNPNMSVLLAVAQIDQINSYVTMLFQAGLDPIAIDIEPLATGRSLLDVKDSRAVVRPLPGSAASFDASMFGHNAESVAIVNVGGANTDISIFENGQLIFPRSLPLAGDSLTRAISESLDYSPDQAEQIKREYAAVLLDRMGDYTGAHYAQSDQGFGFEAADEDFSNFRAASLPDSGPITGPRASTDPLERPGGEEEHGAFEGVERTQPIPRRTLDLARRSAESSASGSSGAYAADTDQLRQQVFEAIVPVLSELATELRRSLDYYRTRSQGQAVQRILLCGGSSKLPGLDQFLDHELQVPVSIADPLANFTVTAKNFDPAYLQSIAPVFGIAAGLAAREGVFAANPPIPQAKAPRAPKAGGGTSKFFKRNKTDTTNPPGAGANTTLPPVS